MKKTLYFPAILLIAVFISLNCIDAQQPSQIIVEDGGTGPYKAIASGEDCLSGFTIYRPQDLSVFGKKQKLPIVLWGNGGCSNSSAGFKNFLSEIASNGYFVIAIGPFESLVSANEETTRQPTKSAQLLEALNWITKESNNKSCLYYDKIDISKVAVMGQSCGGLQAMEVSTDPRVTTTVICNSGVLNTAPPAGIIVPVVNKDILQQLHAPIIYIIGGSADIAYPNATDDFSKITKVPVVIVNQEVGHGGTYRQPHGGDFSIAAIAWLKWQLKGDKEASQMFLGENCGLCNDPKWKIEIKNIQ